MKVLCVLYEDPIDGYPTSYPRDEIPKIERYFGDVPCGGVFSGLAGALLTL
jgi:hypothetical protein